MSTLNDTTAPVAACSVNHDAADSQGCAGAVACDDEPQVFDQGVELGLTILEQFGTRLPRRQKIAPVFVAQRLLRERVVDLRLMSKGSEMADKGSLIEQDDHNARLDRAFAMQDEMDTLRIEWDRRVKTLGRMQQEGGSFVRSLAIAASHADPVNYQKLAAAFPEYWSKYGSEM